MLLKGNCLELLAEMPDNSVDSIVTDPPYELGFMGKSWDNSGIAYNVELWSQALRVLKPGGHLLAFGGSRTYHRLASAIEDAGFEIRDQIMYLYGSGFPKSHNVSKGIDKSDAVQMRLQRQLKFCAWMRSTGLTASKTTEILRAAKVISENGTMAGHFFATSNDGQPAVATVELFDAMRPYLPEVPEWVEQMVRERTVESENFKKRKVVGTREVPVGHAFAGEVYGGDSSNKEVNVTLASTPAAKQWDGWGTALKPAHEPIVVARKPLIGTIVANVLTYGTGALNIDGSRVGTEGGTRGSNFVPNSTRFYSNSKLFGRNVDVEQLDAGRWPANVIHDGSDEVLEYFGEPQRFFYCAKASKSERNAGLEGFEPKRESDRPSDDKPGGDNPRNRTNTASQNFHPTVKPIALMCYLVKLVTPPNGTVLDPFLGSGTTAVAAILEGFNWMGCEMTEDYWPIIEARVAWAELQPKTLL